MKRIEILNIILALYKYKTIYLFIYLKNGHRTFKAARIVLMGRMEPFFLQS